MAELGPLLGRWHQWRSAYHFERGYSRILAKMEDLDDDDKLDQLQMELVEREVASMPHELQLALQHVARYEAMGVECIVNPRLGNREQREALVARAMFLLYRRLVAAGVA